MPPHPTPPISAPCSGAVEAQWKRCHTIRCFIPLGLNHSFKLFYRPELVFKGFVLFYIFKVLCCFTSSRLYILFCFHLQGFMLLYIIRPELLKALHCFTSVALNCTSRFRQQIGRHSQIRSYHSIFLYLFSNSSNHK